MQVLLDLKNDKKQLRTGDIIAFNEKAKKWEIVPRMEFLDFCVRKEIELKGEIEDLKAVVNALKEENTKLKEHINVEYEKLHKALQLLLKEKE